jgi:outer membrane protein assembly factor BamB
MGVFGMKKNLIIFAIFLLASFLCVGAVSAATNTSDSSKIKLTTSTATMGLATSSWPKFHHDNNNTGQSQYKGPQTNTTKWKSWTGTVSSSPAIGSDGTIYFGANSYLYALNPTGTLKWYYTTGEMISSSPAIGKDGIIYFGSGDKNLYALNPTGTLKWKYTTGGWISSSPAIGSDGTIYFGSFDKNLYALNPTGTLKWKSYTGDYPTSPAIGSDGTIYISGDYNLVALNPTGTLKWKMYTGSYGESSPAIGSDGTIYYKNGNSLWAINPTGTSYKWIYDIYGGGSSSPAIGSNGTIYIGSGDKNLYALNPNGTLKWKYTTGGSISSSPAIDSAGTIYFGSADKNLYALNPTGTLKWKYTTDGSVYDSVGSPAIGSDGTIYVGSYNFYAIQDRITPLTASATPSGGYYNTSKTVTLKMSKPGTIYYTKNGTTPTTSSTKYTTPILITATTTLKFLAKGLAGNLSPIYSQKYTIDKIAPKVSTTTPTNGKTGISRTSTIAIKFNEKVKPSTYYNNIKVKNLTTGKYVTITKTISSNILNIKTGTRTANTWYQVTIPKAAIKDIAGNNLLATYTFKFKTGA